VKKKLKDNLKIKFIPLMFIIFSIICGYLSEDGILGTIILTSGFLNVWYASLSKSYNFLFGIIYCLLTSYVSYINGLYGLFVLSIVVYMPLQLLGWIDWNKKKNKNNEVKIRRFTFKNSILITTICIVISLLLGSILANVPGQQLAFLDASSNALNLCGIILMHMRFRECWWVWLANNVIDLTIWLINAINNSPNSTKMLLVSISYLVINIYGVIRWQKYSRKNIYTG
jgi:nicotinamide mononucleotide transporter